MIIIVKGYGRGKFASDKQRKKVMAQMNPKSHTGSGKVVVRKQVDGTVVTYEEPAYVGHVPTKSGGLIPRYMNKDEAIRWSQETGHSVKKI